jgi:hypothetical protein
MKTKNKYLSHISKSFNIQLLLCIKTRENVSDLEVCLTWVTGVGNGAGTRLQFAI